jgi:hypothetical protein
VTLKDFGQRPINELRFWSIEPDRNNTSQNMLPPIYERNERTETSQRKRDLAKTFENSLTFEFEALRNGISLARVTLRDTPKPYWRRHSAETTRAP